MNNLREMMQAKIKQAMEAKKGKEQAALQNIDLRSQFDKTDTTAAQQALDNAARDRAFSLQAENQKFNQNMANRQFNQDESQFARGLEARALDREQARQQQLDVKNMMDQQRKEMKDAEMLVPGLGYANTVEDAKNLKNSVELKDKFDRQLQEMIDLRTKHGGGALLNREDVARGKQLSSDLLLTYKDLSKLGVLSAQDTAILNSIIPEDPLAYDMVPGQDPIMNRLKKFKEDSASDYNTRLKTRLRPGQDIPAAAQQPAASDIKTINGKTYKKVPGGWEEQ
jgi:hypothetical protein